MDEKTSYQVLVCNIAWGTKVHSAQAKKINQADLPNQISLDIPETVLQQANKHKTDFNDIVEQFVYNILYKKFGREVNFCQIWLPLENT